MLDIDDWKPLDDDLVIDSRCEWLDALKENLQNREWLSSHADRLYRTILRALEFGPAVEYGIQALILVYPHYALTQQNFERWSILLRDGLLKAQNIHSQDAQLQLWSRMGNGYILSSEYGRAHTAFNKVLERAVESEKLEMVLAAYIGLLEIQSLRSGSHFSIGLASEALQLAERVHDLSLKAALHQALAVVYMQRVETYEALGHGQMAYAYWHYLDNQAQKDRSAYVLANACRLAQRYEQAERFLNLITQKDYTRQYALFCYEKGVLCYEQKDYDSAHHWLSLALTEFERLKLSQHIASAKHALAILFTEIGRYSDARVNLDDALAAWNKMNNLYEQAVIYHAIAYLELQQGGKIKARSLLENSLALCKTLPDSPLRRSLEELIWETIAESE
jgi:tetratricopeptide (TPR) repeat protein